MSYETLLTEVVGSVGVITFTEALNAINTQMVDELGLVLDEWNDKGLKAVILTGTGRSFAAGADISQMSTFTATEAQQFALHGQRVLEVEHFQLQPLLL